MTSSRMIQQELMDARSNASDPHNNQTNSTIQRLREKLNEKNNTEAAAVALTITPQDTSSNSTYADTITGPEGGVYQISGPEKNDVQELIESLMAYNVTLGGNCSQPTRALYSTTFCQSYNATQQNPLDFQACDGSEELPEIMMNILNNATLLCPAPTRGRDHNDNVQMAVASTVLGLLMLLVAGLTWRAHQKVVSKQDYDSDDSKGEHSYQPVSTNSRR
jgi:hypothetical protein